MFIESTIILILVLSILHFYLRGLRIGKYINKIPGPRAWPIIGNALTFMVSEEQMWHIVRKMSHDYYPIYRIWSPYGAIVNIIHADDAEVLLSSMQHIEKSVLYKLIHPWFGTGLLTSSGTKWHQRRKILTPAFHFNVLQKFMDIIEENSEKLIKSLKSEGESVKSLVPLLTNYTLNVICETAMGTSLENKEAARHEYRNAIDEMGPLLVYRLSRPWLRPEWIFNFTLKGKRQEETLKILHGFSTEIINERKEYHEKTNGEFLKKLDSSTSNDNSINEIFGIRKRRLAMLDLLIAANQSGIQIDDDGIREEVDTFMFEGHDTSAMGMCFILLLLAEHKEVQERARKEINEVMNESGGKLRMSEIQRFHYLEQCIKESLRLYPSVPFISRQVTQDLHLKKYLVPKGSVAHVHVYDLHRDATFWPEPNKFDPDRFLPEKIRDRHPFSFIPFSAGPRNCIGQKFAMLELKAFVAHLLHSFYLEPIDLAHEVPIVCDLVIRPARPVYVKLIPI